MKAKPQTKTLNNERNQRKRKISNFLNNNTTVTVGEEEEEKGESKKLEKYNDNKNNNNNQLQRSSQEGVKLPKNQLVQCPICQKSLPIVRINTHLDVCSISSESSPKKKRKKKKKSGSSASMKSFLCITRERENQSESELQQAQCKVHSSQKNNSNIQNNAFTKMMKSSLDMVRSNNTLGDSGKSNCNERKKKTQRLHLHPDWTLTWKDENNGEDEDDDEKVAAPAEDEIVWSSSTVIQKELLVAEKNGKKNNETQTCIGVPSVVSDYEDVELVISSSIQMKGLSSDYDDSHPLINYKMSRLSIPVLKSMLQKLIRRRVPSAAVHIALELALKSWREFIRRLPIIIIEDSTIHPEFPLLVWAMVSESKGGFNFDKEELSSSSSQTRKIPPLHFLKRFLQIVYEVASCSYQDILMKDNFNSNDGDAKMTMMSLRNSVIQKEFGDFLNDKNESKVEGTEKVDESLILRSILLRAHYGGMKGDIIMLLKYAQAWRLRFLLSSTHHHDEQQQHNIQTEEWNRVPFKLHSKSNKVSSKIVDSILSQKPRIEPLSMKHMSFAGIDFHCSSILEDILLEQQGKLMMHQITTIVSSMIPPEPKPPAHYYFKHQSSSSSFPEEETNDTWVHKNVFSLMKTAMWKFSSGVNHRQDLSCYAGDDETIVTEGVAVVRKEDEILQKAWNIIHPHVSTYARNYIQSKLNR